MECTDRRRIQGYAVGAKIGEGFWLANMATVMDAEMIGIARVWQYADVVAADTQAVVGRIAQLKEMRDRGRG